MTILKRREHEGDTYDEKNDPDYNPKDKNCRQQQQPSVRCQKRKLSTLKMAKETFDQ